MYKNILFIEDEQFIAELYAQVLEANGFKVKIVGDGLDGYEEAKKGNYDLILLDLMLPNMTGMEILRRLRNPSQSPGVSKDLAVIVLTNLEEDDLLKKQIGELAQGYLLKVEITPKQLVAIINKMADKQKQP